jgi:hypothetical protein
VCLLGREGTAEATKPEKEKMDSQHSAANAQPATTSARPSMAGLASFWTKSKKKKGVIAISGMCVAGRQVRM